MKDRLQTFLGWLLLLLCLVAPAALGIWIAIDENRKTK